MSGVSFSDRVRLIRDLNVPPGVTLRFNCPFCGNHKTLAVTNDRGNLLWHCFHASCHAKGNTSLERDTAMIRASLMEHADHKPAFELPSHLTNVLSDNSAINYLRKNNCLEAYAERRADIRFDVRQRRVVFCIKDGNEIVDAAGRALDPQQKPKWFRYGSSGIPFMCGSSTTGVIVEDAASACAVSSLATGIALLGTSLQSTFVSRLKPFDELIVTLDRDAATKALELQRFLSFYVPTRVCILNDDLKYYSAEEIRNLLQLKGSATCQTTGDSSCAPS